MVIACIYKSGIKRSNELYYATQNVVMGISGLTFTSKLDSSKREFFPNVNLETVEFSEPATDVSLFAVIHTGLTALFFRFTLGENNQPLLKQTFIRIFNKTHEQQKK